MSSVGTPDFLKMYEQFKGLKPGPRAELRRVVEIQDLIEVPAFYQLLQGRKGEPNLQRVIYCLPCIKHEADGASLGQALAKAKVSEKRLFTVIRSQSPNDLIQLRRLLQMAEPVVDWAKAANTFYFWNDQAKRRLLEDYFFYQTSN
jgi:CRISPR system Cascade subunit CasB